MAGKTEKKRRMKKGGGLCGSVTPDQAMNGGTKNLRSSAKRSYRKRVAGSMCRGLHTAKCRSHKSCKMALGKKRSFCRKVGNSHRSKKE